MDELRCRFFGDEEGEVDAVVATGGGDGLVGGDSNGSGGGGPFFRWYFSGVRLGGGMDFGGGVEGGLIVLGCLGDEGVDREGPGWGVDFLCRSSRFLNSNSFSNFSRPGLKDLTKGGVDCLGGVLGGNFLLLSGGFDNWAYVLAVGELLVPTWVDFRE